MIVLCAIGLAVIDLAYGVEVEVSEIWTAIQEEANVEQVSYSGICADGTTSTGS